VVHEEWEIGVGSSMGFVYEICTGWPKFALGNDMKCGREISGVDGCAGRKYFVGQISRGNKESRSKYGG